MFECKVLSSGKAIDAIADEWRSLHARIGRTPFSDYDWIRIWWNTVGKTNALQKLIVVAGWRDGKLAGALPLVITKRKGLRVMQAAGYKIFHYCDMLAEDAGQAIELWKTAGASKLYHFADVRDVYPGTLAYEALERIARKRDLTKAYYLRFAGQSGEEWVAALSAKTRGNYKKFLGKLEEKGHVRCDVYKDGRRLRSFVEDMIAEKSINYRSKGRRGILDQPAIGSFFQEQVARAAEQGRLLLFVLCCGEQAIAYNLCFHFNGIIQGFFMTHDRDWTRYSPGRILIVEHLKWCMDNGFKGYNFMHGGGDYKQSYVNEVFECPEFTFSGAPLGNFIETTYFGLRTLARSAKKLVKRKND